MIRTSQKRVISVAKHARDQEGLTPKEAKFAKLLSQGLTGADAFRQSFVNGKKLPPKSCWEGASRLRARSNVAARVRDLLHHARLQDLDSVGEAIQRTKELIGEARENRNYSAAMKGNSDLLKMHGLLRDSLVISFESSLTDDQLLDRLAQGNPDLKIAAQQLLRAPNSFAQVADDPSVIDVEPAQDMPTNEQDQ